MGTLKEELQAYRTKTFRITPGKQLTSSEDALAFVQERGFITLWPIKGIDLPSLWTAVAGERPVADEHDDPGHITWRWKDSMLDQRRWYYGKLLRGKATIVSLDVIPNFYALSERVADLDDYRPLYHEGRMTYETYSVAEALLHHGPQHTIQLRRLANLSAQSAKARFDKALTDLQRGLWVLPIGIAEAGAWRYAFIYELFDRWFPEVVQRAHGITQADARVFLARCYLDSVGAAQSKDIAKLFRWPTKHVMDSLTKLEGAGDALPLEDGRWISTKVDQ
jgi:uncharacterized protein YcaQ